MHFKFYPKLAILITAWLLTACMIQPIQPVADDPPRKVVDETTAPIAVPNLRTLLSKQLQIDPATIEVVSAEQVEWSDSCLGVILPDELCAQVITPGYKITFAVNGQEYVFHTDETGHHYRLAAAPEVNVGEYS